MLRFFPVKSARAAVEPLPSNSDNRNRREEIQVTRVPDAPKVGSFRGQTMKREA
jgi:hypothetical protein